jgi:putative glutamine amidotransferase
MVLGVTDTLKDSMKFYIDWLHTLADGVEILPLSYVRGNLIDVDRCSGLVLTGGGDVHPKFYGRGDAMGLVHDVDEQRDEFEFAVIERALSARMPILGICRGMQVCNVALGGTLVLDVQNAGARDHGKPKGARVDPVHQVSVVENTLLHSIVGTTTGAVNTHHHQAVDNNASGLRVAARSPDGIVESAEWEFPGEKPFLLLVQWHPERMEDVASPFSFGVGQRYVREVKASANVQSVS